MLAVVVVAVAVVVTPALLNGEGASLVNVEVGDEGVDRASSPVEPTSVQLAVTDGITPATPREAVVESSPAGIGHPACTLEFSCPVFVNGERDLEMERVLFDRSNSKFGLTITRLGGTQGPGSLEPRRHVSPTAGHVSIGPLPPGKYRAVPHLYSWPELGSETRIEVVGGLEQFRFELTDGVVTVDQPIELVASHSTAFSVELPPEVVGITATLLACVVGPFDAIDPEGTPIAAPVRVLSTTGRDRAATHFTATCFLDPGAYELVLVGFHVDPDGPVTTFVVCEPFTAEPATPKTVATRALGGCLWGWQLHEPHPRAIVFPVNGYSGITPPPRPPALTRFGVSEEQAAWYSIRCPLGVGRGPAWVLVPGLTYAFDPSQSVEAEWSIVASLDELQNTSAPERPDTLFADPQPAAFSLEALKKWPEPGPSFTFVAGPPGSTIERE
ncbi:hypothetical protein [Planctomycetes bacterium Pla163]|uniref:hypothetical protein n=1 Tax=Rohdeia mirabilis TaxID=2528008 RepID=UPI00119D7E91